MSSAVPRCPHCAAESDLPLLCDRCGWRWYDNPRPAAATLVERGEADDAEVLVVQRAVEPGFGAWDLPAGYLEPGESAEEGALRETREEAGLAVELTALAGVYSSRAANAVTTVYRARPSDAAAPVVIDAESTDHAWVRRDRVVDWLPRMAFASMAAALEDWALDRLGRPDMAGASRDGDET
ncbi:MAG: NUDIX domain-containing protein [Chloroflexota bacterium]|nr:NUDIX domain-containing protein [Chloroflexota bacterium]